MEFIEIIIKPVYSKVPECTMSQEVNSDFFQFNCTACGKLLKLDFRKQINSAWIGKTENVSEKEKSDLEIYFSIGDNRKSHDGGLSVFDKIECEQCKATYLTYSGVNEFSNSAFNVYVQGVVRVE